VIFADMSRQQTELQETIDRLDREHAELTQQLEETQERVHQLGEQVLAKQLEIDASNARTQVGAKCLVIKLNLLRVLEVRCTQQVTN